MKEKKIYYTYGFNKFVQLAEDVVSEDKIDPEIEKAVIEFFPFVRAPQESFFYVPNWAKIFLYQFYALSNIKNAIKYLNGANDREMNLVDLYPKKVPFMLIDDIDLISFTTPEFNIFLKNQENAITVKIEVADTENESFCIKLSVGISILNLKRLILYLNDNKPFFLEKSLTND